MNGASASHCGGNLDPILIDQGGRVEKKVEVLVGGGPGPVGDRSGIWGTSLG